MDPSSDWQSDRTLPQCTSYMFENHVSSDVTFVVGAGREEVLAHKFPLISRSPVFQAMLQESPEGRVKIDVPDVDTTHFRIFIRYLYTDQVKVTAENVLPLVNIAEKYRVNLLTKRCNKFLKKISHKNACEIMEYAHKFSNVDLYDKCLSIVRENFEASIRGKGFTLLSRECVNTITKLNELRVAPREEYVYEQVIRWADAECWRQNIDPTWQNRRKVLEDVLYNIRFPLMDVGYFSTNIDNEENALLTAEEKMSITRHHSMEACAATPLFKYSSRQQGETKIERVVRMSPFHPPGCWHLSGNKDAISFKPSHESLLHGIMVYGCVAGTTINPYKLDLAVKDKNGQTLASVSTSFHSDSQTEMHDILLTTPVKLAPKTLYTVEMLMVGASSKRGSAISDTILYGTGKRVRFYNADVLTNGTDIEGGQIPGLLLS